jgi:uncharacterized protein (TIGR02145 family)
LIYPAVDYNTSYIYSGTPTLFLPTAGYRSSSNGSLINGGSYGTYWSSAAFNEEEDKYAYCYGLHFRSNGVYPADYSSRANGFSVRCVAD